MSENEKENLVKQLKEKVTEICVLLKKAQEGGYTITVDLFPFPPKIKVTETLDV